MATAKDYYDLLEDRLTPKQSFLREVAKVCKCSVRQARRYVNRETEPSLADKEAISKITGIPVLELYPEEEVNA